MKRARDAMTTRKITRVFLSVVIILSVRISARFSTSRETACQGGHTRGLTVQPITNANPPCKQKDGQRKREGINPAWPIQTNVPNRSISPVNVPILARLFSPTVDKKRTNEQELSGRHFVNEKSWKDKTPSRSISTLHPRNSQRMDRMLE